MEEFFKALFTAGLAVLGSLLTFKYQFSREFKTRKRAEFLEKQLSEFYGPLKILHREIRVLSEMRVRETQAFDKYAREESARHDEKHAELIEKHNEELRSLIIPTYEMARELFLKKAYLAELEVINGYDAFFLFLKSWRDHLEKPIGARFPSRAAIELSEERPEPVLYFKLVEEQFEQKRVEYSSLFKR